jgi:monoamine oxidase
MIYDYIIIGSGITGLYAMHKLCKEEKEYKILLIDERDYFGGRIYTNKMPQYEAGAARYNDNHKILLKLIEEYKLTNVKLEKRIDYLEKDSDDKIIIYKNIEKSFEETMKSIIRESSKEKKEELEKYTLREYIDKISKEEGLGEELVKIFGYYSEFERMNCKDSLRAFKSDFISNNFYVMEEGLTELCVRIAEEGKKRKNVHIKQKMKILNIKEEGDKYKLECDKGHEFKGRRVIIATKSEQLKQFKILKEIFPLLKEIYNAPLCRIYAVYPKKQGKVWFEGKPRMTTNSFLRQIIPIDYNKGIIMISYVDGEDINPYYKDVRKKELKSDKEIKNMIQKEVKTLFPRSEIPNPSYFKIHYWEVGVHHYKKGVDSIETYNKIKNPLKNIYVVGEAYSQKQAWMEGGLETVEEVYKDIINNN